MSWIKIDTNLASKPEVFQMARACRTTRPTVVGHLVAFWGWIDVISRDGQHLPVTTADIDALVGLDGFAAALRAVNWLSGRDGDYSIPLFERHNGSSGKARWLEAEAKRLRRLSDNNAGELSDTCPTKPVQNVGPEKRREEKKESAARAPAREPTEPPTKPEYAEDWRVSDAKRYPLPAGFDTPEIRAGWVSWIEYLVGRFGPSAVSTPTLQQHLAKLKEFGPASAVAAMRNAASKNFREPCPPLPSRATQEFRPPQRPGKKPIND